ncbi:MAG: translation initiation factor Sui1 [Gammaproteobacteria bacterium]|nr:MAG: translation initiation factor Sui1 [Gammaproteobacteria bacterium]
MAKRRERKGGLVYSTDQGRMCPGCLRPQADCVCNDRSRARSGGSTDGAVIVSRETKGRKGAGVTLISGLPLADNDLAALAKKLKARCGVGGSVKEGVIELQGEQRDRIVQLLEAEGYRAKRSGG